MQNLQNMASLKQARKEKGFTIIELVVVILLLGILAATALPRFMDATDEAHAAVVDAVEGGLATSAALFRAQWFAKGQPTTAVPEFGSGTYLANNNGYPEILAADSASCTALFTELLQSGSPDIASYDADGFSEAAPVPTGSGNSLSVALTADFNANELATAAVSADFVAVKNNAGGTIFCHTDDNASCTGTTYYSTAGLADVGDGTDGDYTTAQDGFDAQADTGGSCTFYYTGQWKTPDADLDGTIDTVNNVVNGLETLTYTIGNGDITRSVTAYQP